MWQDRARLPNDSRGRWCAMRMMSSGGSSQKGDDSGALGWAWWDGNDSRALAGELAGVWNEGCDSGVLAGELAGAWNEGCDSGELAGACGRGDDSGFGRCVRECRNMRAIMPILK